MIRLKDSVRDCEGRKLLFSSFLSLLPFSPSRSSHVHWRQSNVTPVDPKTIGRDSNLQFPLFPSVEFELFLLVQRVLVGFQYLSTRRGSLLNATPRALDETKEGEKAISKVELPTIIERNEPERKRKLTLPVQLSSGPRKSLRICNWVDPRGTNWTLRLFSALFVVSHLENSAHSRVNSDCLHKVSSE